MPKIVEVQGLGNVEFPDTMDDNAIGAAIAKQLSPKESPRQKMADALNKLLPGVPESSEQAIGMGMGMSMPNPLPFVGQFLKGSAKAAAEGVKRAAGSMFPKAMEAGGAALDPVLQQAPRNPLPALPKILEHVPGIGTPAKIYNMVREAASASPREAPASPYPQAAPTAPTPAPVAAAPVEVPVAAATPPQAPPTPQPGTVGVADLKASTQGRLARALGTQRRLERALQASRETAPVQQVPPTAPPAAPVQSVPPQATAQPAMPTAPARPPPQALPAAVNIFEKAARSDKVAQLVKAIDANAGMHLGVDMRDPRAAEALASLPAQWWEGMAQASGVNKPSQETINQALEFFRDRAAQGVPKLAAQ